MSNHSRLPLSIEQKELRRAQFKKLALDFYKETGKSPRIADISNANNILQVYRTWNDFLKDCGLPVNRTIGIERETLINQCKTLAEKLGRPPTVSEFTRDKDTHCEHTVVKLFGSWNNFIQESDLKFTRVTGTERDDLIQRVLELASKLGHPPTRAEFNQHAKENNLCTSMVVQRYFGTWTRCLEYCGLEPNIRRK